MTKGAANTNVGNSKERPALRRFATGILSAALAFAAAVLLWQPAPHKPGPSPVAAAPTPLLAAPPPGNALPAAPHPDPVPSPTAATVSNHWSAGNPVFARETTSPDGRRIERVRVLRTGMKHPLVRIEESLVRGQPGGPARLVRQRAAAADHFIIQLKPGASEQQLLAHGRAHGITILDRKPLSGIYLLKIPRDRLAELPDFIALYQRASSPARVAELDYILQSAATPNDPSFSTLWGMHNTGQSGGTADADIDAPEVWNRTTGGASVLVGVIDSGIDLDHPDLAANLWTNPGETAGNGIDDDKNGYVDDVRGWDFANDDNNPDDDNGHGTHCAGTIGAVGNNGAGVAGVCWTVRLAALKFLDASGSGYTSDAVEAVYYATRIGAHLTSNSWGGAGYSSSLASAIFQANAAGILFIAAAGNDGANTDSSPHYPSSYSYDNIISVAASTRTDARASFSNYGATSVDLAAPGASILSTYKDGGYATMNGTSMATPHVAGACALLKAWRPSLTGPEIKAILLGSVDPLPAFSGIVLTGGRLNANNALSAADGLLLSPAGGFSAEGAQGGPFTPASAPFSLRNLKSSSVSWSAAGTSNWLAVSPSSGTLAPGAQTTLTVSFSSAAAQLPAGAYTNVWRVESGGTTAATSTAILTVNPVPAARFDLATSPGWTAQSPWAFGKPSGQGGTQYGYPDPSAGATGNNVYGVNLNGDYSTALGGPYHLTTGPINLSGHSGTKLRFRRWLNTDYPPYVTATVELSTNGSTWSTLWTNPVDTFIQDNAWTTQTYDISAIADGKPAVYFRWSHRVGASGAYAFSGWNLDDIEVLGTPNATPQPPAAPALHPEPPITGGAANAISWSAVPTATGYQAQAASTQDFAPASDSVWTATNQWTFTALSDGPAYYRVRAGNAGGPGPWSQTAATLIDATPPTLTLTRPDASAASTPFATIVLEGAASDANGIASVTVNGAPAALASGAWSLTVPLTNTGVNRLAIEARDHAAPPNAAFLNREFTRLPDADGDLLPDDWETAHGFGLADDRYGDPDGDGIGNLLEYLFNLDPRTPDNAGLPSVRVDIDPATGRRSLLFSYRTRTGLLGVNHEVQISGSAGGWTPLAPTDFEAAGNPVPNADGATETVTLRVFIPDDPSALTLLRLAVSAE